MHRISNGTQVGTFPPPGAVIGTPGFATAGNPALGLARTIIDPDCFNALQEEVCHVIESAGFVLDKTNSAQLQVALRSYLLASSKPNYASYTTPGTYTFTVPAGVSWVVVTCVGGGGGGSQCVTSTGTSASQFGGGGGAGALAIGLYYVVPAQAITVTVGAGGNSQANGGTSSFGVLCSCTGGNGSAFLSGGGFTSCPGGVGGVPVGGNILNVYGGYGNDGQAGSVGNIMGSGAPGPFGGGGRAGAHVGANGQAPGAGGGGAYDTTGGTGTGTLYYGGSGFAGCVLVEYFQVTA